MAENVVALVLFGAGAVFGFSLRALPGQWRELIADCRTLRATWKNRPMETRTVAARCTGKTDRPPLTISEDV